MSNLAFLLLAVLMSAVGVLVLWWRHRPRSSSPTASIEEFAEKMRALAPDDARDPRDPASGRRGG